MVKDYGSATESNSSDPVPTIVSKSLDNARHQTKLPGPDARHIQRMEQCMDKYDHIMKVRQKALSASMKTMKTLVKHHKGEIRKIAETFIERMATRIEPHAPRAGTGPGTPQKCLLVCVRKQT